MAVLRYYDSGSSSWLPAMYGSQGIQGTSGAGTQGTQGVQGTTGTGTQGTQGTSGAGGGSGPSGYAAMRGFTTTVTSASPVTLTNTSTPYQLFTGSTAQTVVLPVTSTLTTGWTFHIDNDSTAVMTINSSGGNLVLSVPALFTARIICVGTALTTAADWDPIYNEFHTYTGSGNAVFSTSPTVTNVTHAAGTTALAPIVFTPGVKLTTPLTGAMEFETDELYVTTSSTTGRGMVPLKHMVVNQANSTAATTTTPQSRLYRFRGRYKFTSTFTSGTANVQILFTFSNAPAAINYDFRTFVLTPNAIVLANTRVGTVAVATATQVTPAIAATISYVCEFEGWIKSHATLTSTLTPQFQMSVTGSSTVVTPYSFFEIEKIGTDTDTLVAGNWA
jgi:hypothetical protein